ncbi:F0F1 ATP synthase subunit gamma [Kaarinaea lacus]
MTRRRELEEHRYKLGEIRDIMNSMKILAYMETRKLNRFLDNQQAMIDSIEAIAADFVSFFPETLPATKKAIEVYLLIGSERGFCGNFNEALLPVMESCIADDTNKNSILITVGHKLHTVLEADSRVSASIDGANVVEEVEMVLTNIVDTLVNLLTTHPTLSLFAIYHAEDHGSVSSEEEQQILMQKLLPPFERYQGKIPGFPHPPILNVPPADFFLELTDHYLLSALHEILYTSLMVENRRRVQHLDGAVQHIEEKTAELTSKCNALRQEEIIEEIEVILLSAASLDSEQTEGKLTDE